MKEFSAWSQVRFPCQGFVTVGGWPGTGFVVVGPLLVTDPLRKAGMHLFLPFQLLHGVGQKLGSLVCTFF